MREPRLDPGTDREVGLALQAQLDAINEEGPPTYDPPPILSSYRHPCARGRGAESSGKAGSASIDLHEEYLRAEDGIHALVYREGHCPKCWQTARSRTGRVVLVADRPPLEHRVARD